MLEKLMRYVKNWFLVQRYSGEYTITDGSIDLDNFLQNGQYFRIVGSVFNDGVYKYDDALSLVDETFKGEIWALAVPQEFITLANKINDWLNKYGEQSISPYNSESFGGYTYSKSGGYAEGNTPSSSWQYVFKSELNMWRKI